MREPNPACARIPLFKGPNDCPDNMAASAWVAFSWSPPELRRPASRKSPDAWFRIDPSHGPGGFFTSPYRQRYIPPVNLTNTPRLDALIRSGNLYLSAQDVITLALENNIDIEVQRYGPSAAARSAAPRRSGGPKLRNVGLGVAAGPTSVSLTGVTVNTNGAPSSASGIGGERGWRHCDPARPRDSGARPHHQRVRQFPASNRSRKATRC